MLLLLLQLLLIVFRELTDELLDLHASVRGATAAAYAMVQTCCSCCCCCIGQGSGD